MSDSSSRREFLQQAATATAAISAGIQLSTTLPRLSAAESPAVYESPELAALRRKAARRRRRLIYNDDGCGPIMQPGGDSPQGFLDGANSRMRVLPGTQVDSVFICSGATHVLNHPTKVAESYADVADKYQIGGEWALMRDNMRALEKAGTDAVQLTIDFCRRRRLEVVYSHRINDIHNQFLAVERSTWFREHPQYWLNTPENASQAGGVNSPRHWWSALDFERPEVLAHLAGIQEEVCGRYDIDGIEIDYFRSPMFFRPNLDFDPATPDQREILTGFQRRLRELHFRAGTKRNRPILTIARVPATVERCLHVGIDIERWMQERLVDLLTIGGGYIPFTEPLEELVASAHRADIPVYATISASGMRGPENRYSAHEAWRGAARPRIYGRRASTELSPSIYSPRTRNPGLPTSVRRNRWREKTNCLLSIPFGFSKEIWSRELSNPRRCPSQFPGTVSRGNASCPWAMTCRSLTSKGRSPKWSSASI